MNIDTRVTTPFGVGVVVKTDASYTKVSLDKAVAGYGKLVTFSTKEVVPA